MDEQTRSFMMSEQGIKALWDRIDRVNKELAMLWNWTGDVASQLPATEPASEEAAPIAASPTLATDTPAGSSAVEPGSECAHEWMVHYTDWPSNRQELKPAATPFNTWNPKNHHQLNWCQRCGALWLFDRILAPAAGPDTQDATRE